MSIRKINNSDYKNLLISNLPTRPNASPSNFGGGGLSANQMKKAYDATPLFIIGRFNDLIDYINGTGDARLADDILNAIKGVLASKVETDIEGIATLSDLFASVESGDLVKAIRVSDGKSLDETLKIIGEETITEVERTLTEYEAEKLAPIVAEAEILRESVSSAQSRLSRVEKKVENLGAALKLPIIEDTEVAYTKIVPDGALPYAEVAKVGGMSHKTENGLRHAKVTEIKSESANLIPFPYYDGSRLEHNGITFNVNADGSIHVKGTATAEARFYLTRGIQWASEDVYSSGSSVTADGKTFKSVAYLNSGTYPLYVRVSVAESANGIDKTLYPTINYGDTALPFTPYAEYEPLPIPEAVQALDGYGFGVDAEYHNYIDWEAKKYHNEVITKVIGGTYGWWAGSTNGGGIRFQMRPFPAMKANSNVVCDKYATTTTQDSWNNIEGISSNGDTLQIKDDRFTTVSELKAHLAENPITVVYALATPEVTDISDILSDDNFIRVEGGGTITAVNEFGLDAPTEIIYQKEGKQ